MRNELIEKARSLSSKLASRRKETNELRRVPDSTVAELHEAGFFRMLQPKSWGGLEVDPKTFFEVQIALAKGCPSTAWVMSVLAVHNWQLGLFPEEAQKDVWTENPDALISSSYAPTGKVEAVEGGFELSGRWSFSSGCDHCDWVFLGGLCPEMRTFLVHKSDYTIEDNWHVAGLKGSGSKDIVIEKAFVPNHRTHKLMDGFHANSPGNQVNTSALFRIPFGQIFVRSVATTAVGIAEGALEVFLDTAKKRIGASDGKEVVLDPTAKRVAAEAQNLIDEVRLVLHRNCDELLECAEREQTMPLERRVLFRYQSAHSVRKCTEVTDMLFSASGGRAIFSGSAMQQYFQDMHAVQAHFANKSDKPTQNLGGVLLGHKTEDYFL
jgi:3-hydroxy-9,10-secoandrosta-1,3,5(10)-triene-9,17-dione monooxygenase